MAVRFLPPPEEHASVHRDEGENLAEVVEMRSWLRAVQPEDTGARDDGDSLDERDEVVDSSDLAERGPVLAAAPAAVPAPQQEGTSDAAGVPKRERAVSGRKRSTQDADLAGAGHSEAYEDAVRLLARRARSSGELRHDLLALDYSADEVSIVIDEFIANHYLDDIGLARVQSEKLRDTKGASRGQIARKLRERKLPDAVIEEIIGELDTDEEYSLLREAASKRAERLAGLDRQTAMRRLLGFLARRGWSGEPAVRAANEALDGGLRGGSRRSGEVRFE